MFPSIKKQGYKVGFLSGGTDGIDGPTDAAGAVVGSELIEDADEQVLKQFLKNNNSNTFFKKFRSGRDLIVVGHTGTNVMDVHGLILKKVLI
jgi:glycerate 2-kinase